MSFKGAALAFSLAAALVAPGVATPSAGPSDDGSTRTVKEALADPAYLARFDAVHLEGADPNLVIVDGKSAQAKVGTDGTVQPYGACDGWIAFTSITGGYGPESSGCGVAGSPGFVKGYYWSQGSAATVCSLVLGFGPAPTWYWAKCGGTGGASVPWGNVIATAKLKASGPALYILPVHWAG